MYYVRVQKIIRDLYNSLFVRWGDVEKCESNFCFRTYIENRLRNLELLSILAVKKKNPFQSNSIFAFTLRRSWLNLKNRRHHVHARSGHRFIYMKLNDPLEYNVGIRILALKQRKSRQFF